MLSYSLSWPQSSNLQRVINVMSREWQNPDPDPEWYWDKYVDPDGYHPCGFWTDFFGCPKLHTENVKSLLR